MSAHDPDTERFEEIEAFLLDKMPPEVRTAFIASMERDAELREEVEVQRDSILSVELAGFTRLVQAIGKREAGLSPGSKGWTIFLKYAAMVALVLAGTIWWSARPDRNERLYAEYHVADPGLPVPMSISKDPVFQDAMVYFKMGEYEQARARWAPLLQRDPGNDTLRYYIASALLEMDSTSEAGSLLESVARDSSSRFSRKAQWYLFLIYLKTGQLDKLRALPLDNDPTYGDRVRAIKTELN